MKYYLVYDETHSGGERLSDKEHSDRKLANITFIPKHVIMTDNEPTHPVCISSDYTVELDYVGSVPKPYNDMYIVVVRYSDGDSFGRADGHWEILFNSVNKSEAKKFFEDFSSDTHIGRKPWDGNFAHYQNIEFHALQIFRKK